MIWTCSLDCFLAEPFNRLHNNPLATNTLSYFVKIGSIFSVRQNLVAFAMEFTHSLNELADFLTTCQNETQAFSSPLLPAWLVIIINFEGITQDHTNHSDIRARCSDVCFRDCTNPSLYPHRHHSWVPKTRRYSQCKGNWFTPPHAWVSLWASLLLETFPSVTAAMSLFAFDRTDVEVMVNQIIFEEPLVSKHRKPQLRRLIYSTCFVVSSHAFFLLVWRDTPSPGMLVLMTLLMDWSLQHSQP